MDQAPCMNSMAWVPRIARQRLGSQGLGSAMSCLTLRSQLWNRGRTRGHPREPLWCRCLTDGLLIWSLQGRPSEQPPLCMRTTLHTNRRRSKARG